MEDKLLRVNGKVKFAGINVDNDTEKKRYVVTVKIPDEAIDKLRDIMGDTEGYDSIPLKEQENGTILFKASSGFPVKIYEDGEETENITNISIEEIGEDSTVTLFVKLTDVKGMKKKKHIVAYLKSIDIKEFLVKEAFNPFDEDADIESL